ncbi:MAG: tetratricopeptide repeat protein, partial [Melioribacteraceae bacterium]|nr:tetratricopeptide repeat protein [Melioribacteraceae bacterium]
ILEYQEALKLDPQAGIYYSLAKDYLRLNKLFPALENAKNAVKLEQNNIEYLTLLGTIYNLSRNADSAEAVFSKIVSLDSTDVGALYSLAQIYEPKQPLKALKSYKRILEITGSEWNVMLKIAELNERLGKIDETIMTVEDLLELNPSNLELKKLLIESYIKNEKYEKALNLVNDALELFPEDLSLLELRGNTYVKMEKWDLGAEDYKNIISTPNVPFNTKLRIGTAFYSEALNDSSLISYAEDVLLEVDKDSSDWQVNAFLGELANSRGDDSLTLHYFRRAIELAELNSDLRIRLGQILFENGEFETASIEMKKAVEKFPQNHVINLILGLSLAQNSNHEEALPFLRESVNLNPNDLNSNLAYSFSLNQTDNEDEAIKYLNRTLRIDPQNVQALGMMGLIYDGKEMYSKSDSIYALAIAADSTDVMILNNFAYSLAERGIELERALKMVQKAVDQEPENSSYLDTIGWVYYQLGQYESALKYIEKAIEFDPSNATLLDHLGDVYFRMGNGEKAIELWKESLLLDSSNTEIQTKIENGLD